MRTSEYRKDRHRNLTEVARAATTSRSGVCNRYTPHPVRLVSQCLLLVLLTLPHAYAATLTVTTTSTGVNADTLCSLTEAIDNANADANDGAIHPGPIAGVFYPSHTDCAAVLPGDVLTDLVDVFQAGNWMIRAFGGPPPVVVIPTIDSAGLGLLALLLGVAGSVAVRRRQHSTSSPELSRSEFSQVVRASDS